MDTTHRYTNPSAALPACKLLVSLLPMNLYIPPGDGPGGAKAEATLPSTPKPSLTCSWSNGVWMVGGWVGVLYSLLYSRKGSVTCGGV